MKKTLLIILCFYLTASTTYAQNPNLSMAVKQWQGVWKGISDNDTVYLYIVQTVGPAEKDLKDKDFIGMYGWHSIKQNNIVLESSIENADNKWNDRVTITASYKPQSDSMHLIIKDITRNMLLGANIILVNDNEAILKTWMKETWRNDDKVYPSGQTFPKEIRLVRQPNGSKIL